MATVKEFMDTDFVTLGEGMTLREASEILLKRGVSGAAVVGTDGELKGFITERDIINRIKDNFSSSGMPLHLSLFDAVFLHDPSSEERGKFEEEARKISQVPVKDVMWKRVIFVNSDDTIEMALHYLSKYRINRMPVMEKGKIVGIISRKNVLDSIFRIMERDEPSSDDE